MQPKLDKLRQTAGEGLLSGAGKGLKSAAGNFGVLNRIARATSGTLGGLAADAGKRLGSKSFGADLGTLGMTNVRIIGNLGHATLDLADAARHLLVEAGPLAEWLSQNAAQGAKLTDEWVKNKRATGDLSKFFQRARGDLTLLASIGGHAGRGILNLFGAQDVDGTKTLASLNGIFARFEQWSSSPAVRGGVGKAIADQIPNAAGAIASVLASTMGAAAPKAAEVFLKAFLNADAWGKLLIGGVLAKKLGLTKIVTGALGGVIGGKGPAAAALSRGATPANPMWVQMVGWTGIPGGGKGPTIIPPVAGGGSWLKAIPGVGAVVGTATALNHSLSKKFHLPDHRNQPHNPTNPVGNWLHKHIPGFATGGTVSRTGPILVGENGPEVRFERAGTRIAPMPLGGFDRPIHNVLMLDGRVVYEAYNRHNRSEKARH
jgi:hypothetical protein